MKRYFSHLCLLLSTVFIFASCLDEDTTEVTLYDDIAITAFGISSAKIYKHTTSSTGADSIYTDMDGTVSYYPFHIDHLRGEIYNTDSLPLGIDASKMLCTYSTMNSGIALLENITGDSVAILSTTDTIDFSAPRYVRVHSMDNSASRRYKITVNVHHEDGDTFKWNRLADFAPTTALSGMNAVNAGGRMLLFGTDGNSTKIYSTAISDGNTWEEANTVMGPDAWRNVALSGDGRLYVLDGSTLLASDDNGSSFSPVAQTSGISRLLGGSTTALYGLGTAGDILFSEDGGQTWLTDITGDDMSWMPAEDISFCCTPFRYNASTDYLLLAGNRTAADHPEDTHAVVWRKISEYAPDGKAGQWIYMTMDDTDIYPLPRMSGLTVMGYGNSLLAMGNSDADGNGGKIYESRDGGITWKTSASYPMPENLNLGNAAFAAATDADNNIWIVCGGTGEVWRGRLNKMGWTR